MFYAVAMYHGGQLISVEDDGIDYHSYKELGLLCPNPECRGELLLKDGSKNQKHFAHRPDHGSQSCPLRRKSIASSGLSSLSSISHEQREILFKDFFLDLVRVNHSDLSLGVKAVDDKIYKEDTEDIISSVKQILLERKQHIILGLRQFDSSQNLNHELLNKDFLNRLIASEAFNYILLASSSLAFQELAKFAIYKTCGNIFDSLYFQRNNALVSSLVSSVLVELVASVDWSDNLEKIREKIKPKCPWCKQSILRDGFADHVMFECVVGQRSKESILRDFLSDLDTIKDI